MKKSLIVLAMLAAAGAASAQATDYASVRRVTPQYTTVTVDREVCETHMVTTQSAPSSIGAGTVIGGIAGGLLGAQVGKGNGRVAAAAVGAGVGALVGNSMETRPAPVATTQPVTNCRLVPQTEQRANGYLVDYDYNGRSYSAVLPHDPGRQLRVNVSVTPAL